jgi:caffeoyl-CoA O-methyltransferase
LPKLSDDGLIAIDNVLWSARVLTDADQEKDSVALRAFNERLAKDPRLECVMLTVRDGVKLARPRRR